MTMKTEVDDPKLALAEVLRDIIAPRDDGAHENAASEILARLEAAGWGLHPLDDEAYRLNVLPCRKVVQMGDILFRLWTGTDPAGVLTGMLVFACSVDALETGPMADAAREALAYLAMLGDEPEIVDCTEELEALRKSSMQRAEAEIARAGGSVH